MHAQRRHKRQLEQVPAARTVAANLAMDPSHSSDEEVPVPHDQQAAADTSGDGPLAHVPAGVTQPARHYAIYEWRRQRWTMAECSALIDGIRRFGLSWVTILEHSPLLQHKRNTQLADKFKTFERYPASVQCRRVDCRTRMLDCADPCDALVFF